VYIYYYTREGILVSRAEIIFRDFKELFEPLSGAGIAQSV
jgi:hypothetical protein